MATSVTHSPAWKALEKHFDQNSSLNLNQLFAADQDRFKTFSTTFSSGKGEILLDYSKNLITSETLKLLLDLAKEQKLEEWRDRMFGGDLINTTETRAVLHVALRNRSNSPILVDGKDVMPAVNQVLDKMKHLSNQIGSGEWRGYTGKVITDIINIGIGGSDLGPVMVDSLTLTLGHHSSKTLCSQGAKRAFCF
jgi:glucose-6-phosphate isomerase